MSLINRPPVIVNGIQRMRTFHYFWCQICQRNVRFTNPIYTQEILCPYCSNPLDNELDISRPRLIPPSRFLDSLADVLDPPPRQQLMNNNFDGPWITFQLGDPPSRLRPIVQESVSGRGNYSRNDQNFADNVWNLAPELVGPFVPNFTVERPGPPPALASVVEALPLVKVTEEHLLRETQCPVCKEEYGVGEEVRELPCKHFYHLDCINPWLSMHNTCPVCRYEIHSPVDGDILGNDVLHEGDYFDALNFGFEELNDSLIWLRDRLFSLRPVRAISDWTRLCFGFLDSRMTSNLGGQFGISCLYFVTLFGFLVYILGGVSGSL